MTEAKRKRIRRRVLRLLEKETKIGVHIKEHIEWCISGSARQFFKSPRKFMYEAIVVAFACAIEGGYFILKKKDSKN